MSALLLGEYFYSNQTPLLVVKNYKMKIYLNNEELVLDDQKSIETLLKEQGILNQSGIAVALNSVVVSKNKWNETQLNESDQLMVIKATAGG